MLHSLLLTLSPKSQPIRFTNNSESTQGITATMQSHLTNNRFNCPSLTSSISSHILHSDVAQSLITQTTCTSSYTLPLSNFFLASSLLSLPGAQSMIIIENHSPTSRTPMQFRNPPFDSHDQLQKLHPRSSSAPTIITETNDTNNS